MKYIVDVKDVSCGTVEVEADSIERAEELAEEMYFTGQVPWADCDVSCAARPNYRANLYFDRNGNEIKPGMQIVFADGRTEQVYATTDAFGREDLGISATNEAFLKNHPDWEREYFSLSTINMANVEICAPNRDRGDAR